MKLLFSILLFITLPWEEAPNSSKFSVFIRGKKVENFQMAFSGELCDSLVSTVTAIIVYDLTDTVTIKGLISDYLCNTSRIEFRIGNPKQTWARQLYYHDDVIDGVGSRKHIFWRNFWGRNCVLYYE